MPVYPGALKSGFFANNPLKIRSTTLLLLPCRVTGKELLVGKSIPSDGSLNDHPLFAHGAQGDTFVRSQVPRSG